MSLPLQEHIEKDGFRLRGLEVSRIDAFSDVVFGFALTLLVVSLEVPKKYSEFHANLREFLPFAVSFGFLMMVWYSHYKYFRRFGTHDFGTIVINSTLLFVVLFYVYPLKFLFMVAGAGLTGDAGRFFENSLQVRELMMLYGFGFAAIYLLFATLYWNGLRQGRRLDLTGLERLLTRGYMFQAAAVGLVGLLSSLAAWLLPPDLAGGAGWVYLLVFVVRLIARMVTRRRVARFRALHKLTDPPRAVLPTL